jgi:D-alanyl-D-alanine carboxypeptidase
VKSSIALPKSLLACILGIVCVGPALAIPGADSTNSPIPAENSLADLFQKTVAQLQTLDGAQGAHVSFWLKPANQAPQFSWRANENFVPASVLKCVTAASYLEKPPCQTFRTQLFLHGTRLRIVGGWDPELSEAKVQGLARQVASKLPKKIDVLEIESSPINRRDPEEAPPTQTLDPAPGESNEPALKTSNWPRAGLPYNPNAVPYPLGWGWDDLFDDYAPEIRSLSLAGGLLQGKPAARLDRRVAQCLSSELANQGIAVARIRTVQTDSQANLGAPLAWTESRPCVEILRQGLAVSDNFILECFHQRCQKRLPNALATRKGQIRIVDGSGMSRYNLISAQDLGNVIDQSPELPTYLPTPGGAGTLHGRMIQTPLQGHLWAKTGTMSGVTCLAGSMQIDAKADGTRASKRYTFVWMCNGFTCPPRQVKAIEDQWLIKLQEQLSAL